MKVFHPLQKSSSKNAMTIVIGVVVAILVVQCGSPWVVDAFQPPTSRSFVRRSEYAFSVLRMAQTNKKGGNNNSMNDAMEKLMNRAKELKPNAGTTSSSSSNDSSSATSSKKGDSDVGGVDVSGFVDQVKEFDFSAVTKNLMTAKDNASNGEFGTRGEVYFVLQAVLVVCILLGNVPIIGDPIEHILGPLFVVGGVGIALLSVVDLGSALSPFPQPVDNASLQTSGVYQYVRHPMYAGLLCFCLGVAVTTDSSSRLVLTALLWYVLEIKSNYEETKLMDQYGSDYSKYQKQVPGKFVPHALLEALPWTNTK